MEGVNFAPRRAQNAVAARRTEMDFGILGDVWDA